MSDEPLTSAFTLMRSRILQFASRFFPERDDAEDALSDAFCRLWPNRSEINSPEHAEAAAKVTIRRMGIDRWRRRQQYPVENLDAAVESPAESSDSDLRERFNAVSEIIDSRLTPLQRQILRMHDMQQRDYAEIAETLSMQEAAVRMQLSRARRTIRDCYFKRSQCEPENRLNHKNKKTREQ